METESTTPARQCLARARAWAAADDRVSAAFAYGSVALRRENDWSDRDLVIVASEGKREELWSERAAIATRILDTPPHWSQELPWQRPYRYQAWLGDLTQVDITFDERRAAPWQGLANGFEALVDRDSIGDRLRTDLSAWRPPPFDAHAFDRTTWPWLLYLAAHLRRGACWFVRAGLYDTLNSRVVRLLGAEPHSAEALLGEPDLQALHAAAPRSSEPVELRRALKATVALYDHALDQWAARTGDGRPLHPLAGAIRKRIEGL